VAPGLPIPLDRHVLPWMVMSRTMTAPWILLLVLAASAGCYEVSNCDSGVLGHPSDVKTVPGDYDGYEVIKGCPLSQAQFALRGLAPWTAGRRSVNDLCAAIARPGTVFGCGQVESACTTDGGRMDVSDWRAVDSIIDQVGRLLNEDDSYMEIAIHVYPPPCE
jgi:hypothetical protein